MMYTLYTLMCTTDNSCFSTVFDVVIMCECIRRVFYLLLQTIIFVHRQKRKQVLEKLINYNVNIESRPFCYNNNNITNVYNSDYKGYAGYGIFCTITEPCLCRKKSNPGKKKIKKNRSEDSCGFDSALVVG